MKLLVILVIVIKILLSLANEDICIATRGKYWDEDSTPYFKEKSQGKGYLDTQGRLGLTYSYNPQLVEASKNQIFTFKAKRNNKSQGVMFYYQQGYYESFQPNLYWTIEENYVMVTIRDQPKYQRELLVYFQNDKIDQEFIQLSVKVSEEEAILYIDGVMAQQQSGQYLNFGKYYYNKYLNLTYSQNGSSFDGYVKDIYLAQDVNETQENCLLEGQPLQFQQYQTPGFLEK